MTDTKLIWITNGSSKPSGSVYTTWVKGNPKATKSLTVQEIKEQGISGYYAEKWEVDKFKKDMESMEEWQERNKLDIDDFPQGGGV